MMYLHHFALTRFPFHDNLLTDELFESGACTEAETRLHHLLELKGIGLLTGEVGSGKTTVCRKVTAALHSGLYRVFYVTLSTGHVMDMYKAIAWELGLPTQRNRSGASREIRLEITRLVTEAKQQPVLVVDEAHHLRNDVLEDLRLLTHYHMDSDNRLCLLLIGLTELRRRLSMTMHESLDQMSIPNTRLSRAIQVIGAMGATAGVFAVFGAAGRDMAKHDEMVVSGVGRSRTSLCFAAPARPCALGANSA